MRRGTRLLIVETIMTIVLLSAGMAFWAGMAGNLRMFLDAIVPAVLELSWATYRTYYLTGIAFLLMMWLGLTVVIWERVMKRSAVRDADYMKGMLRSSNKRTAMVSVFEAVATMLGTEEAESDRKEIEKLLRANFEPIREFIRAERCEYDVLVVSAPWGDGKTSNVLMAVDDLDSKVQEKRRYIYCSLFNYTHGLARFHRDILGNLEDVLREWGIEDRRGFAALGNYVGADMSKALAGLVDELVGGNEMVLADGLIKGINDQYVEKFERRTDKDRSQLVVIIDDLDRMTGEEIRQVLSLLGMLRKLSFVKIIVPMEPKAVAQQLEHLGVYQPQHYVNKFLPEQCAIKLRSKYQMVEEILLRQIRHRSRVRGVEIGRFRPALAAVLMRYLVDILEHDSENWTGFSRIDWGMVAEENPVRMEWGAPSDASNATYTILDAADEMSDAMDAARDGKVRRYIPDKPSLDKMQSLEQIFGSIIYSQSGKKSVAERFTNDVYNVLVGSWIFDFVGRNWDTFGITLRELKDLLGRCNLDNVSMNPGKQFCDVFNQYFPEENLVYAPQSRKAVKKLPELAK